MVSFYVLSSIVHTFQYFEREMRGADVVYGASMVLPIRYRSACRVAFLGKGF